MLSIQFLGAAGTVTGSKHLVRFDGERELLVDCGLFQGPKQWREKNWEALPVPAPNLEWVALTHAHLDHCGYLPHVYSKKAKPRIWLTKPTRDLMGILLSDYHRIHYKERETRKLFTIKEVNSVMQDARVLEPGEPAAGADFHFSMHQSGHILGSAMVRVPDGGGVLYTGDICMRKSRILDACDRGLSAHTLLMESTYGQKGDIIPSYKESATKLVASANRTLDRGGHVIIPSFAVGRAQEILMILDDYMRSGALAPARVYVEGMIGKALRIYRHNAYYANDDIKKRILMSEDDPFKSKAFHYSISKERKDVLKEPCIIVTTSGMLTGGPVLFYLEKLGGDPRNKLIFVGFQAPGTPGQKIIGGERKMRIKDREIDLKLEVEQVKISGHADFNELVQFAKGIRGLKRVFLMHGEKTDLAEVLEKDYEVVVPRLLESYGI